MVDTITPGYKNIRDEDTGARQQIATKFIDFGVEAIVDGDLDYTVPDGFLTVSVSSELVAGNTGAVTLYVFTSDDANEVGAPSSKVGGVGRTDWYLKNIRSLRLELRGNSDDCLLIINASNAL